MSIEHCCFTHLTCYSESLLAHLDLVYASTPACLIAFWQRPLL